MKTPLALALLLTAPAAFASLEVHEWGTFTTLSDSSGITRNWYLPDGGPAALPEFVERNPLLFIGKVGALARVRMETPVLYFYPDQPGPVSVEAQFAQGRITEVYPGLEGFASGPGGSIRWSGELRPPDDPDSRVLVPTVESGSRGEHYAAARAVPEAWNFVRPAKPGNGEAPGRPAQAERFIFYRGSGEVTPPLHFSVGRGPSIQAANMGAEAVSLGVALEVRGDRARWTRLPELPPADTTKPVTPRPVDLPDAWTSLDKAETNLSDWFRKTLHDQGLSDAEAAAMVATWRNTWFREPGMRAFTLVPRTWVDSVLPLTIEPRPDKLVRVFVARHELLSADREQALTSLLLDETLPEPEARAALAELELGRFSAAAVDRAAELAHQRMQARHRQLVQPAEQAKR